MPAGLNTGTLRTDSEFLELYADYKAAHTSNRQLLRDLLLSLSPAPLQLRASRYGAMDTTAHTAAAIGRAMDEAAQQGGGEIFFDPGVVYSSDPIATPATDNLSFHIPRGATVQFPGLGVGVNGFTINGNNYRFRGRGKILGPSNNVYVQDERIISMQGASSAARKSGLYIEEGLEIGLAGAQGVYAKWVDDIQIPSVFVRNCGYAGMMFLSCDKGRLGMGVRVKTIGPGSIANMYGVSLTHDSTNYNTDPNAGTPQALNPFCSDWVAFACQIEDVNWEGFDCHGGYNVHLLELRIWATMLGISSPSSSGAAAAYAGWLNRVSGCIIDGRNRDGTFSGRENTGYAINANGGATVNTQDTMIDNNTAIYKGVKNSASAFVFGGENTNGVKFHHNIAKKWNGNGIILDETLSASVVDNTFEELADGTDTIARCISCASAINLTPELTIQGNRLRPNGGTAAKVGLNISSLITKRPRCNGNDFDQATTTPYQLPSPGFIKGSDMPNILRPAAGDTTPDVSDLTRGQTGFIVLNPTGGSIVITNFLNGIEGQEIQIENTHATNTITVNRANAVLSGGVNAVLDRFDTLRLRFEGSLWVEQGRSANA